MRIRHWQLGVATALAAAMLWGCRGGQLLSGYEAATGGYPQRGVQAISQFRCGSCHTIRGISSANGVFGPPLIIFGRGTFIAGVLPNTPDNLARWIENPQSVKPKTAMPALGVSEQQARDI